MVVFRLDMLAAQTAARLPPAWYSGPPGALANTLTFGKPADKSRSRADSVAGPSTSSATSTARGASRANFSGAISGSAPVSGQDAVATGAPSRFRRNPAATGLGSAPLRNKTGQRIRSRAGFGGA